MDRPPVKTVVADHQDRHDYRPAQRKAVYPATGAGFQSDQAVDVFVHPGGGPGRPVELQFTNAKAITEGHHRHNRGGHRGNNGGGKTAEQQQPGAVAVMHLTGVEQRRQQRFTEIDKEHLLAHPGKQSPYASKEFAAKEGDQAVGWRGGKGEIG